MALDPDSDITILYEEEHADRAVSQLPSRYRGKPRIEALARALALPWQDVEDEAWTLLNDLLLPNASGWLLDILGDLVGEDRAGLDDTDYRRFIAARMLVNRADDSLDDLIAIWQLVMDTTATDSTEIFPLTIWLIAQRDDPLSDIVARRVVAMMEDAKPAGRTLRLVEAMPSPYGTDGGGEFGIEGLDVGVLARLL